MIVYHGSSCSKLKRLEYSEETSRFGGEMNLVHGAGIYLTVSKEEALAYATASLYTIKVSGEVFDATDSEILSSFVASLFNSWNVDLSHLQNTSIQSLIKKTSQGKISGVGFSQSLFIVISNEISLYGEIIQDKFNDDLDALENSIKAAFSYPLVKIHHQGNNTDWIICLDHDGRGIEIVEEEIID